MRGTVRGLVAPIGLVGFLLLASVLAGCVSDDGPEPPRDPPGGPAIEESRLSFLDAEQKAFETQGGEGNLLAAIGISSARPDNHESVTDAFPAFGAIAEALKSHPSAVPGDGDLPAWAFIYDTSGGLSYVVMEKTEIGSFEVQAEGTMDREELLLLRAQRAISGMPEVSPGGALDTALSDGEWASAADRTGIFVFYILTAGSGGAPQWRLIVAPYDLSPFDGRIVTINGGTGNKVGETERWPENLTAGEEVRGQGDVNPQLPGDDLTIPFQVGSPQHPRLWVNAYRTGTGEAIGDPNILLNSPDGDSHTLGHREWAVLDDPAEGEWEVVYEWEMLDVYRSIRVQYCLQPVPFLFAERPDSCTPEGEEDEG